MPNRPVRSGSRRVWQRFRRAWRFAYTVNKAIVGLNVLHAGIHRNVAHALIEIDKFNIFSPRGAWSRFANVFQWGMCPLNEDRMARQTLCSPTQLRIIARIKTTVRNSGCCTLPQSDSGMHREMTEPASWSLHPSAVDLGGLFSTLW